MIFVNNQDSWAGSIFDSHVGYILFDGIKAIYCVYLSSVAFTRLRNDLFTVVEKAAMVSYRLHILTSYHFY
jgi:hypothetical protein